MGNDYRYTPIIGDSGSYNTNLAANDANPQEDPGVERSILTPYGPAKVRYGQCVQSGGCLRGELQAYRDNVTITNATSGSTTTLVKGTWTAKDYDRDVFVCADDAADGGADPEGFATPIITNDTTTLYFSDRDPLPAVIAANDDGYIWTFCKSDDAAAGDEVSDLYGIAAAALTVKYWGWYFFDGVCPYALVRASTALTAAKAIIAHTARVDVSSTSSDELLIGQTLGKIGFSSDLSSDIACVQLDNLGHARSVSA